MPSDPVRNSSGDTAADDAVPAPGPGAAGRLPEYDSRELLAGGREAIIRHGAQAYRLQLTGSNKLILTK